MAYNGTIDLISGIRPKNNGTFPLVDAKDVRVTDDERLDASISGIKNELITSESNATDNTRITYSTSGTEVEIPDMSDITELKSLIVTYLIQIKEALEANDIQTALAIFDQAIADFSELG